MKDTKELTRRCVQKWEVKGGVFRKQNGSGTMYIICPHNVIKIQMPFQWQHHGFFKIKGPFLQFHTPSLRLLCKEVVIPQ